MAKKKVIKKRKKNAKEITVQTNLLLLIAAVLFIFLFFLGFLYTKKYSLFEYKSPVKIQKIEEVECLQVGNTCTNEEIINGIKVRIPVNANEFYDFYVISNSPSQATYLMSDDLERTDWHDEVINFKGPEKALKTLNNLTSTWSNIPIIENYSYEDYGYVTYTGVCDEKNISYPGYDCDQTPGYQKLKIDKGKGTVLYHLPPLEIEEEDGVAIQDTWDFDGTTFRARLITLEEIGPLGTKDGLVPWLVDNSRDEDAYWTMTSNGTPGAGYVLEAHTIVNRNGKASVESEIVSHNNGKETVSIRPVITIPKK